MLFTKVGYIGNIAKAPYEKAISHFVDRGHRVSCFVIVMMGRGYYVGNESTKPGSICDYEVLVISPEQLRSQALNNFYFKMINAHNETGFYHSP